MKNKECPIKSKNSLEHNKKFLHRDPDTDSISKIGHRQLSCLYDFINASRKIIYTDTWGYYINGTWTGMLGYMVQGEAELSGYITVLIITLALWLLPTFCRPVHGGHSRILLYHRLSNLAK